MKIRFHPVLPIFQQLLDDTREGMRIADISGARDALVARSKWKQVLNFRLRDVALWPVAIDRIFMADGRFGVRSGHGRTRCRLDPVARDPRQTSDRFPL